MATRLRRKLLVVLLVSVCLALQVTDQFTSAVNVSDVEAQIQQTQTVRDHDESVGVQSLQRNDTKKTQAQVLCKLRSRPFMLLTSSNSSSSDAVVAAVIAPRFLLTMTNWIAADAALSLAVSAEERIPVKQVWFERDISSSTGIPGGDSSRSSVFAVVELERDASFDVELSASPPAPESALQVVYLDPFLLSMEEELQSLPGVVASNSACELSFRSDSTATAGDSDAFCVTSGRPQVSASVSNEPSKMVFAATPSGQVIGVASSNPHEIDGSQVGLQSFIHFGSAPHMQFLDQVTGNSINWGDQKEDNNEGTPSPEPTTGPEPIPATTAPMLAILLPESLPRVSFFEDQVKLDCGGIQIAKSFILTTASCVLHHHVTSVSFQSTVGTQTVPVTEQKVHPMFDFNSTAFDIAILAALSPGNPSPTLVLEPRIVPSFTTLDRLQLGEPGHLQPVELLPREQCKSKNVAEAWTAQCIKVQSGASRGLSTTSDQPTNAALLKRLADSTGYYLTGLQQDTSSPDHFVRVSDSDVAAFIDVSSAGHKWATTAEDPSKSYSLVPTRQPARQLAQADNYTGSTFLSDPKSYAVGLRLEKSDVNFCSGVLIAASYVLTAASCVSDGIVNYVSFGPSASPQEIIQVVPGKIMVHPKFGTPSMVSYNAAILELKSPSVYMPIALDIAADFEDGTAATMTRPSGSSITVPVWSKRKCKATIPDVDDSSLCAGGEAGKDACTGDSGSPLTVRGIGGQDYLIGVVSAGYGCGLIGKPGLYARIAAIRDFIAANTVGNDPPTASSSSSSITRNPNNSEERANSSSSGIQQLAMQNPVVQNKILSIVVGSVGSTSEVRELKDRLATGSNSVVLYSTGDLAAVAQVIEKHNVLPLNKRQDRFGTVSSSIISSDEANGENRGGKSPAQVCGV